MKRAFMPYAVMGQINVDPLSLRTFSVDIQELLYHTAHYSMALDICLC